MPDPVICPTCGDVHEPMFAGAYHRKLIDGLRGRAEAAEQEAATTKHLNDALKESNLRGAALLAAVAREREEANDKYANLGRWVLFHCAVPGDNQTPERAVVTFAADHEALRVQVATLRRPPWWRRLWFFPWCRS